MFIENNLSGVVRAAATSGFALVELESPLLEEPLRALSCRYHGGRLRPMPAFEHRHSGGGLTEVLDLVPPVARYVQHLAWM